MSAYCVAFAYRPVSEVKEVLSFCLRIFQVSDWWSGG